MPPMCGAIRLYTQHEIATPMKLKMPPMIGMTTRKITMW